MPVNAPAYFAAGTSPNRNNTKRQIWQKMVAKQQTLTGNNPSTNPLPTDTIRQLEVKFLKAKQGL